VAEKQAVQLSSEAFSGMALQKYRDDTVTSQHTFMFTIRDEM
jgi:hypothetical protein